MYLPEFVSSHEDGCEEGERSCLLVFNYVIKFDVIAVYIREPTNLTRVPVSQAGCMCSMKQPHFII